MSHIADLPFLPNALESEFIPPLELIEHGQFYLISWETQLAAAVAWQAAGGNADNDGATLQAVPPRVERRRRAEVIAFPDRRAA
ncbi:MAG: hypothetical protein NVV69_07530 [Methyloversatilis sp.]|jgi:hypothetical protein|uniref:hypothetical protein n=1 Tax=Methyloversatilis TaxID=378210 RepID=UPI00035D99BE|nr:MULTISPECIES: hypothetical protein [Methyloversatilis]MCR6665843.1 hypothetical protein [Methyloversatilis sp.]